MFHSSKLLVSLSLLALSSVVLAQERPDLSGRWIEKSRDTFWLDISLEDSRLIVRSPVTVGGEQRVNSFVYELDGTEGRNAILTARGDTWEEVSQARWMAGAIVVSAQTVRPDGRSSESLTTYYVDPTGQLVRSSLSGALNGPAFSMTDWVVEFERE